MRHLSKAEELSACQEADVFDPGAHVYSVRSAGGTTIGGERYGGRNYRVDLTAGAVTCTCRTPELLHVPCSHVITACRAGGVDHKSPEYMTPLYSKAVTLRIWESRFEPYLDPSQWPEYKGPVFVLDNALKKTEKGRRKNKRLKNDMDDAVYATGDFDQPAIQNRCSVRHELGHRKERHMEVGNKKNKKARKGGKLKTKAKVYT